MPRKLVKRRSYAPANELPQELNAVIPLDQARARREAALPGPRAAKPCRHDRHVGTCPACQRAQLARWQSQLTAVG
jgi:hypothetical protein